ncbi:hypothetical protein K438DRAFT_1764860 [Mycena galopus ATCC 62051]|nr:hypothetical protein K438DRAFT_1764860 [Mycena galopus ATCC 62051]
MYRLAPGFTCSHRYQASAAYWDEGFSSQASDKIAGGTANLIFLSQLHSMHLPEDPKNLASRDYELELTRQLQSGTWPRALESGRTAPIVFEHHRANSRLSSCVHLPPPRSTPTHLELYISAAWNEAFCSHLGIFIVDRPQETLRIFRVKAARTLKPIGVSFVS